MKIGQTSLLIFVSKLAGSIFGFVATLYFARELGAEVLGIYAVIIALVNWLILGGRMGIGRGMIKRISEGDDRGCYLTAGVVLITGLAILMFTGLMLGRGYIEAYVGDFRSFSTISVVWYILGIYLLYMLYSVVSSTLQGQHLVHVAGVLPPINAILRGVIQIVLVFLGFSLLGMLAGYAAGLVVATIIGALYVAVRPRLPARRHFRSLLDYAKFSWLSGLKARAFNDVDILVLGIFVPQSLIGIYAVAWSLTNFLNLFSLAVSQTIFPEISSASARGSKESATGLIEDSLAYAGLVAIPGFVGGAILDDNILRIYGQEFVQGTEVLWLLLLSIAFYGYLYQCLNSLNGIDRPDLAFRANIVFIVANLLLNLLLIREFGWVGAAVASVVSSFVALTFAYLLLKRSVQFTLPVREIGRQVASAGVMGVVVWSLLLSLRTTDVLQRNLIIVLVLVPVGAAVYFATLFGLSERFRETVARNTPFEI